MHVELLAITDNPEKQIARAARISPGSEHKASPENDKRLVRKLVEWGHHSTLEFASATFLISGISRACANQLTRHRLASFLQESMRYRKVDDRDIVVPPKIAAQPAAAKKFEGCFKETQRVYKELLEMGIPKEDARFILPLGTQTRLVVSANFREWRHIINIRADPAAQWEIQELSRQIHRILKEHAPSVFFDLGGEQA